MPNEHIVPIGSQVLTKQQTARSLQVHERTVDRLLQRGLLTRLPGVARVRIPIESIDAYVRGDVEGLR